MGSIGFTVFIFLEPIISAVFGAFTLYIYYLKNGRVTFKLSEVVMLLVLGLFAGYLTNEAHHVLLKFFAHISTDDVVSEGFLILFADSRQILVAISGFMAPKLLKTLENTKIDLGEVAKWVTRK